MEPSGGERGKKILTLYYADGNGLKPCTAPVFSAVFRSPESVQRNTSFRDG
jgi:hypothetical protein